MMKTGCTAVALGVTVTLILVVPAAATESGAGRYFPGMFAQPAAGIVPPYPGLYFAGSSWFYSGSAPESLLLPRNGKVSAGADARVFWQGFTALYVPKTEWKSVSLGFGVTVPFQSSRVTVYPEGLPISITDQTTALSDIIVTPVTIGGRKGTHFWSAGLRVFTPSADYKISDFATPGANYWTYSPNVNYTYLNPARGYDLSFAGAVDLNAENKVTKYRSGGMLHLDFCGTRTLPNGLGFGGIAAFMQQVSDDRGALADRFHGLRGRGMTAGPILKYTAKAGRRSINFSFSWAPEFAVKNRTQGHSLFGGISLKL